MLAHRANIAHKVFPLCVRRTSPKRILKRRLLPLKKEEGIYDFLHRTFLPVKKITGRKMRFKKKIGDYVSAQKEKIRKFYHPETITENSQKLSIIQLTAYNVNKLCLWQADVHQ